jgi:hypothetical protein
MKEVLVVVGVIALIVALVIAGPLLVIWSINTLFGLGIDYTFWTWLAAFILGAAISPNVTVKRK